MQATPYAEVNQILEELLSGMQSVLGERLVGLYLYGSLVWGDFDPHISDIDLMAALRGQIGEVEFVALDRMQVEVKRRHPDWDDRIEVAYISLEALRTFKEKSNQIAIMSPGEPFHNKEAGIDWLLNGYFVREQGKALFGPGPRAIIAPVSAQEFRAGVRRQVLAWGSWVPHTRGSRPYQGYAILTMCRALYALRNGEQVSKRKAAEWAMRELPERANLIQRAWQWRENYRDTNVDPAETYAQTVRFVNEVIALIGG